MKSLDIISFGCRLNACEAEAMRALAVEAGLREAIIVNTCAVTNEAVRQARQAIRKAHRAKPSLPIVVTGCAAQVQAEEFATLPGVVRVLGNAEKMSSDSYRFLERSEKIYVNDIMSVKETAWHMADSFPGRSRAYVQIQNGCDHRCTFCIIPYGRGNSRSIGVGEIVRHVKQLVANGYPEVVLTGVDITSFGKDLLGAPTLGDLVQKILSNVPDLKRLRLSSLDAIEMDDLLMEALSSEKRLMPHLHLSLQSGSDLILKRMKRRHRREDAVALTDRLRKIRAEMVLSADFIVGFPTESDEMFEETLSLVDTCGLNFLHVFPYSAKKGTPAARMPQIPVAIRRERARRLRDRGLAADARLFARLEGMKTRALIERSDKNFSFGRCENFAPVQVLGQHGEGTIVPVKLSMSGTGSLTATVDV